MKEGNFLKRLGLSCVALLLASTAAADAPPLWEAGIGVAGLSQPAYPGAAGTIKRAIPLPIFIYRGPWLRADREGIDLRALKSENIEVDLGFGARLGARQSEVPQRAGMHKLGTTLEVGPRLRWTLMRSAEGRLRLDLPLRGVFDASDAMRRVGLAFEPTLRQDFRFAGWDASVGVGALVGDRKLGAYYYGVRSAEATATRAAFDARSGLHAWRFNAGIGKALTPELRLFSFVRLDDLQGAANRASPLVQRRDGWTLGFALAWTPWHSSRSAAE